MPSLCFLKGKALDLFLQGYYKRDNFSVIAGSEEDSFTSLGTGVAISSY
jgi:hypothetical protein